MGPLVALLGKDMPGKLSPAVISSLGLGVGVGSTDTTDLIGKTRSVADGLIALKGDSEDVIGEPGPCESLHCKLGLHGTRSIVSEPHNFWSWGCESDKERACGDDGGGLSWAGDLGALAAEPDVPGHMFVDF